MTNTLVDIPLGELATVVLSPEYMRSGDAPYGMRDADVSNGNARTFYAVRSADDGHVLIVFPESDPRSQGAWALGVNESHVPAIAEDIRNGNRYRGWNVNQRHVVVVAVPPGENSYSWERMSYGSPVSVGDRVRYVDRRGAGDPTCHAEYGDMGEVIYVASDGDCIRVRFDDGHESLRSRFRFERGTLVPNGTPEATSADLTASEGEARTFTQEDVDRLVREARDAKQAEFDQWIETANARAVEYAEANGLCGEFERCMADIGMMGRAEWREAHQTTYDVRFVVTVTVDASDRDDAEERARNELWDALPDPIDDTITFYTITEA